jgi:hypothetical protein
METWHFPARRAGAAWLTFGGFLVTALLVGLLLSLSTRPTQIAAIDGAPPPEAMRPPITQPATSGQPAGPEVQ